MRSNGIIDDLNQKLIIVSGSLLAINTFLASKINTEFNPKKSDYLMLNNTLEKIIISLSIVKKQQTDKIELNDQVCWSRIPIEINA